MYYVSSAQAASIDRTVRRRQLVGAVLHGTKTFLAALALGLLTYLAVSGPSQWERITYFVRELYQDTEDAFTRELRESGWRSPSAYLNEPTAPVDLVTAPEIVDGHLSIPSIGVDAPILWDVPLSESLNGLQEGVVHAQESVRPGEVGRTFIIGHSAGYWWNKNPWTTVFAVLDQVEVGDLIFLNDGSKTYGYRITATEVVTPKDVHVVRDETLDRNQLALMTCTPVGTTLNRLIVYAEPVVLQ